MSHIEFVDDILVYNSVSAVSGLFADTLEIRTGISSPDFDQVKAASANWDSTYLTVSALSAAWNIDYDGSDIKALTANWESTYIVTSGLSADWTTAFNTVCAWGSSSVPDIALRFTADILGNGIDNTYTYFHGLGTKDLVVSIIEIATGNIALAAVYVTDTQITVEFAEPVSGTLYRLVALGATNLADYASISANWQSTFTTVSSNSSNWETTYTTFRDQSGNFLTSETDSQLLTFDETTKELSISNGNNISLSSLDVTGLTANWETTYSLVSSNSSNWETTYTTFRDQSGSFLTIDADSQTLTFNESNKELSISNGNNISLSSLDVTGLTASWQSTYTTVSTNSANWSYQGADLKALSSNWQNTYSTVSSNSSNWSTTYATVSSNSATWGANPQVIEATVFNADSVTLTRGNVVYSFGATGSTMSVKLASNSGESTSSKTLGFVNGNILPGDTGLVTIAGRMENLEFGLPFVEGDALWLGTTPGTYTRTKPSAPNHGVYLGVVERANSGNGIAYVKVQNGYELNEIHDVLITSPLSGQIVRRNSANTLWINTDDASKWDSTYSTVSSLSSSWVPGQTKVDVYTRALYPTGTATWTKPSGAKSVNIIVIGAGGGGGSGRKSLSGTVAAGGGGGAGGGFTTRDIAANLLGSTESISIGFGGAGGSAVTSNDSNGVNGGTGTTSSFGSWVFATGGSGGNGGTTSAGTGATTTGRGQFSGGVGANGALSANGSGAANSIAAAPGGAGGAGISTTPAAFTGGNGGWCQSSFITSTLATGGSIGLSGGSGISVTSNFAACGNSGAGGGSSITSNGGAGGAGGEYGAGGGGGGASLNNTGDSGPGGPGADGIVIVTTYF